MMTDNQEMKMSNNLPSKWAYPKTFIAMNGEAHHWFCAYLSRHQNLHYKGTKKKSANMQRAKITKK